MMLHARKRKTILRATTWAFAALVVVYAAACTDARDLRPVVATPPNVVPHDDDPEEANVDDVPTPTSPEPSPSPSPSPFRTTPARPRSFDDAKRLLLGIYAAGGAAHTRTLYCNCAYVGHVVDTASCGYAVQSDAARAARLEWEHVVPASAFGHAFREWREGSPSCVKKNKPFRGRKCAHLASRAFARIEGDMHNLFPEDGEINNLRGDKMMAIVAGEERRFGACDIELTSTLFEPRPDIRGDVARAYEYMDETYPGLDLLPDGYRAQMAEWDAQDPPDAWERARNAQIAELQGNRNRFIDRAPPR